MRRTPRSLLAAALCTAALAACDDSPAGLRDSSDDAEVIAANRNLGGNVILTASAKDFVSKAPSAGQQPKVHATCAIPSIGQTGVSLSVSGGAAPSAVYRDDTCGPYYPYEPVEPVEPEPEPYYPPPPPPPPAQGPLFYVYANIFTSSSYGTKYVTLQGSGDYQYASYGDLYVSFRNIGGCYSTPTEYTNAYLFSYNAPFSLSSSRNASYNGTYSGVNWAVYSTGYAESPEGGFQTKYANRTVCF